MKIKMVYPRKKESAIKNYSEDLLKHLPEVESLTYIRGNPFTFPFFGCIFSKKIHIQHEYNLLGFYGLPFFCVIILLKLFGKELILTMHTVQSREDKGFIRRTFYSMANFIINKFTDNIIVHAKVFKDILVNEYKFDEKYVQVIRHGVKEVPKFNKEEIKRKLGLKGKVYLIIGTFHRDHQPHLTLDNAKEIEGTILLVWNSSNGKKAIDYYNETMKDGIPKNVKVIDLNKEYKDMWWEFYYASDFVILKYIEGIGSGIFQDAMATRIPVICSDTKYFNEMLIDFKSCDDYAEKYSVKNMASKHLEVYNK